MKRGLVVCIPHLNKVYSNYSKTIESVKSILNHKHVRYISVFEKAFSTSMHIFFTL